METPKKKSRLAAVGCLLVLLAMALSVYLVGMVISKSGIGVQGTKNTVEAPIGTWKGAVNGSIFDIRSDGTGRLMRGEGVEYFEWRLQGDEFGIFQFSNRNSVGSWIGRTLRATKLAGHTRPHDRFTLIEVTTTKLTMALAEEPHPDSDYKLGDQVIYTTVERHEVQDMR